MALFEHGTSRIYYEESGTGSPVLLLPGWADNINNLSALRELLSAEYRVIAADLPGSGRSEPLPRAYTANYYEDDARSFAALLRHLDTGPAHLAGFSDGGEVALLMAAVAPDVARSVVTWGAAGVLTEESLPMTEAMAGIIDDPIPPLEQFREYLIATYGEANARATTRSFSAALRAIIERGGDISLSRVGGITCPVFLIVGELDPIVPAHLVTRLAEHIPASDLAVVDGAGHAVHDDRREWFEKTLLDWLRKH